MVNTRCGCLDSGQIVGICSSAQGSAVLGDVEVHASLADAATAEPRNIAIKVAQICDSRPDHMHCRACSYSAHSSQPAQLTVKVLGRANRQQPLCLTARLLPAPGVCPALAWTAIRCPDPLSRPLQQL